MRLEMLSSYLLSCLQLQIKRQRLLSYLEKWVTDGSSAERVVLAFGAGGRGWHKGTVSRK